MGEDQRDSKVDSVLFRDVDINQFLGILNKEFPFWWMSGKAR